MTTNPTAATVIMQVTAGMGVMGTMGAMEGATTGDGGGKYRDCKSCEESWHATNDDADMDSYVLRPPTHPITPRKLVC